MTKPNYILHYGILATIVTLSLVRAILWTTPNNKLHELGLSFAMDLSMTLGVYLAFGLAIASLLFKSSVPSKKVFYTTQFLTWMNSIGVWLIFIGSALYATMSGGF